MAGPARVTRAEPLRRDAVLEAVAFAAERLLLHADWLEVAPAVLERFGIAARASRVAVIQDTRDHDGRRRSTRIAEWCAPGVPSLQGTPPVTMPPWDEDLSRWVELLGAGELVWGTVARFPSSEIEVLRAQGIVSLAYAPIMVDGQWWGAIGLDDCERARSWDAGELEGIRAAAAVLGAAIARHRQDERLHDADLRYRTVVERIPAVTYVDVVEPTAVRVGFVSPQIETLLGYPYERFLEEPDLWFDLIHPDDSGYRGLPFDEEYRMRRADGSWIWVHDTSTPIRDASGTVTHFQGFMIDVTARREAEHRSSESEARYRGVVESIPAVTYIDEPTGLEPPGAVVSFVSPQIETILGYPASTFVNDPDFWFSVMHPDDLERLKGSNAFDVNDVAPFDQEYRMRHADGHWIWVHDTSTAVYREDGTLAYFQGFMLDVTERREAQERLRLAEERFRSIVEHTPAITYQEPPERDHSVTSPLSYVSPQVESILGYTPHEWIETGAWARATHPDDLSDVLDAMRIADETGEPSRIEYRVIAADGRVVWFHDESHLIRDADGIPLMWQGVMIDITERKEAEEQLQQARERLQALIEHIPAVVYIESPDADPEKFYLSPQVERIFGYTAPEWTFTPDFWLDHLHPDDRAWVEALDEATDRDRTVYASDYRLLRSDGEYAWVHDVAVFVQTADGEGFWQGFMFDITERKRTEDRLLDAERIFRATVEHLPAVIYREAPHADGQPFYISPQTMDVFGYPAERWAREPGFWFDIIHPDDLAQVTVQDRRSDDTKDPFVTDYRLRHADGRYVWIHDEATYVSDGNGEGFWQGFMIDVTERMEAERQLREAEETFRTIVEHNPAVIYTQSFDPREPSVSHTTYISPRQPEVFGYTVEEVLADPTLWLRTVHPDDRERVQEQDIRSNRDQDERVSMEYRMIAKDGRIVWVQDDSRLVRIEGRDPFWQGFMLDITERKHAEEQLARALEVEREATRRLRALDEMKNTFLQAVSHDLRTPLAAILGLAITLERGDVHLEESDAKDLAGRIAGNARRLDRLVVNLLDLDRLARGIVTPNLLPTDVGSLVRRVVAESELIADSRLRTDIRPVIVRADAAKVERIVENLLANMARHTPPSATIWIGVRPHDDGALLLVEDDGPGVAEPLRETIFEPFRQGPDAPAHSPGVGVGLTLVRRFAELHGGSAWVEERDGGGASFRVFLPGDPPSGPPDGSGRD
jgi:PAS domain S-box-containing protein